MRILVTGATGFVGRHLLPLLLARQNEIFGTYLQPDSSVFPKQVRLLSCDLRDADLVTQVIKDVRPARIYHLAALSSVRNSFQSVLDVYQANFFGTLHLLDAVGALQPSSRILLVGSGHCYGRVKRAQLPITEDQPLAPLSPYGVSKAAADLLGGQFFNNHNLHVIRVRPFNHTGPGQSPEFVCSDFARQFAAIALGLAPPVLHVGNLTSRRDFSDVRDVVRAYTLLMHKGKPGEIYNVCSGRAVSLQQVLNILGSFCPRKVTVHVVPARIRKAEEHVLFGSNRKLQKTTSWRPLYELKRTLYDLYQHWATILQPEVRNSGAAI